MEDFTFDKIRQAIKKAFTACKESINDENLDKICDNIFEDIKDRDRITVEEVQDLVETELMKMKYFTVAKSYILYREERRLSRETIGNFKALIKEEDIINRLERCREKFQGKLYNLDLLWSKYLSFYKKDADNLDILIRSAVELITQDAPDWEFIASELLSLKIENSIRKEEQKKDISTFYDKISWMTENGLYGSYIQENYSKQETEELEKHMVNDYTERLTYSGLHLLMKRYLIKDHNHRLLERPKEMFMGIAMHLAIPEGKNKVTMAKKIYDIIASLKVTVATPTMSNARKPFSQLSSCFEDVMPDNLIGIYRTIDNFAQVSKFGGGMGIYMGKVRAVGSDIRGFKGVAGGVLKWIKLCNDTAVAVDQLGVRQGSVALYLDIWHRDIPEFLQIRTNNGDDRMKAHDVFPGLCIPDLFWKKAKEDINSNWYLLCPHEVLMIKGYCLEDFWGEEWEKRYFECLNDSRIPKREIPIKDLIKLIIKSAVETGTPFIFNRDTVNRFNPNKNHGIIYCSNLCTEIAQNQKEIITKEIRVENENGAETVITETIPGDFVVCNLASLVLGNIDTEDKNELEDIIKTIIRALDNVIDLNFYPVPYAKITNKKMRPIGLGISGYHHCLVKHRIKWESEEHLKFTDSLFEDINYYAIQASKELAEEKGRYSLFEGSEWQNGKYFEIRNYTSERWNKLKKEVEEKGIRNGYLLAIAPTSSTSIIAGTTAGTDPVMNKYFLEEKKGSIIPRVAPQLDEKTFWFYKTAHQIDQNWVIDAAGIRQKHIDQAQSVNLYITREVTFKGILQYYIRAWEKGVKTLYYCRSKSQEVEECESCSA